ncbi:hypothetical protein E3N88_12882 [Mikania micrantha]|uniref:Uncharacterized protein n=1 Tax=Mikania micrantha TaxID=192012 RepID=A0A5N6P768_9ASTR|nr:hypothetical protein E3N88_12882 [Mikania micrantha]
MKHLSGCAGRETHEDEMLKMKMKVVSMSEVSSRMMPPEVRVQGEEDGGVVRTRFLCLIEAPTFPSFFCPLTLLVQTLFQSINPTSNPEIKDPTMHHQSSQHFDLEQENDALGFGGGEPTSWLSREGLLPSSPSHHRNLSAFSNFTANKVVQPLIVCFSLYFIYIRL